MAYTATYTTKIGLPYFSEGAKYSSEGDRRRFLYLDYNLESYIGVIGVGVIDGWTITDAGSLKVTVGYGTAILNGFFSESPFEVKLRANVLPTDYVIQLSYYVDYLADTVPEGVYDEDLGMYPPSPSGGHNYIYDKVLYKPEVQLVDNADNYIYIYRNSNATQVTPYYYPDNANPIAETTEAHSLYTAVAFGVTSSRSYAQSSGRAIIGKVITRNGAILTIDTSVVSSLKDLTAPILEYGQSLVRSHRHGGSGEYDPDKIMLRTDLRQCVLESSSGDTATYRILYSDPTSIVNGHKHYFSVDSDGNGYTVRVIGAIPFHYHQITEYKVASVGTAGTEVLPHEHTLPISADIPDSWDTVEDYQTYINDDAYYGGNESVDVDAKTVTFSDDITIIKRRYKIDKTFSDGSRFIFEGNDRFGYEHSSIFIFMLRAANEYYLQNSEAISNGIKVDIILPDAATGTTPLKNQCIVAEEQLVKAGDTFTFTGEVAPDPVTVILVEPGHVDSVSIEITSNSEVTGKLRSQNVLYIPADKFSTGVFEVGRIPILNHLGRYLERCEFDSSRAYSYDGYVYLIDDIVPWGNGKVVYSVYVNTNGDYLIGTSDGLYSYPVNGLYLFIINGEKIYMTYGDLTTQLKEACDEYSSRTGTFIRYDSDLFDPQIELALKELVSYDTQYTISGSHKVIDGQVVFDIIHIYRIKGYRIDAFGYTTTRLENEVLEDEEVVEIVEEESDATESSSDATTLRTVVVKNDFNKSTVKKLLVENNYSDQYGGFSSIIFALASNFIAKSTDINTSWGMVYQSALMGYIIDVFRNYSGHYVAATSNGLYVCTSVTSAEYKDARLPTYESSLTSLAVGFGQTVLISYDNKVAISDDYGGSWTESAPTGETIKQLLFDTYRDRTSINSAHYHSLSIDNAGNGATNATYNNLGVEVVTTHYHTVESGVILETLGHVHTPTRTYMTVDSLNTISISYDGITWAEYAEIPSTYGEIGKVFSCFEEILVTTYDGIIRTTDGVTWSLVTDIPYFYSASWSEENDLVYFGAENMIYSYDGSTFTLEKEFVGSGIPSVYVNDSRYRFGFTLNNYKRKVDFLGVNQTTNAIDVVYDFGLCYPIHGSWSGGISYDLYVNDKMVKSTHDDVVISEYLKADVNSDGYIDFSVSTTLENKCSYGDEYIDLVDAREFPESGDLRLSWQGDLVVESAFFHYYARSDNRLYLDSPSQYEINVSKTTVVDNKSTEQKIEVTVDLMSTLGIDDNILITIYEGKLKNIGVNSHYDIEDQLSIQNIGSPKSFADVYLSNLIHTTTAVRYALAGVGDDFRNYFLTIFDYNDTPGDPKNISRFIDVTASDFFSQVMYESTFVPFFGTKINRIIFGFGSFENIIFVATNIGLFASKTNLGYEANWFRIDVDGEIVVNDILQVKNSLIFVATEKGLYQNDSIYLNSWTQFNDNVVGGIPLRINARWADAGEVDNSDGYWWQGWNGVTHSNADLINSIFVSGIGFAIVTDDYGITWQKSYIRDSSGNVIEDDYSVSDISMFHDGTSAACLKNLSTDRSSIIYTTGNGSNWKSVYDLSKYTGKILSYVITDYGNIRLTIAYDSSNPPSGALTGFRLFCGSKDFTVINNSENEVVVFETQIVDLLVGNDDVSIVPTTFNKIMETSEKKLLVGTSNGIFTDNGVFMNNSNTVAGIIKSVGVKATVSALNINGKIKAVVFSSSGRSMIVTEIDRIVKTNNLKGYKLKFDGFTDMTVVSNDSSKADGTVTFIVTCDWTSIPSGVAFVASAENNRLYVEFDSIVEPGVLAGGKLYINPQISEYTPIKSTVLKFDVVNNGTDFIDLTEDPSNSPKADWNAIFYEGQTVFSTLSNKTIPLYVEFIDIPANGSLKGNSIVVRNISTNLEEAYALISDNTENIIYVSNELTAISKDENGNKTTAEFVTYDCMFEGDDFLYKNITFESDSSFNFKYSSVNLDHKHDILLYGKFIQGVVSSLGTNTSEYIDINIETISDFNNPPFFGNPSLLEGQDIVFYDPENYSRTYRSKIITASATVIRVIMDSSVFDTSTLEEKKVSTGFSFLIDASLYGTAGAISFDENFIIERGYLTADTFVEGTSFTVDSTANMNIGDKIVMRDRSGLKFETTISSITTPTTFVTSDSSTFDFLVRKDSSYELLFGTINIGEYSLTSDSALGTYDAYISDTSSLEIGDMAVFRDDKGLLFSSEVSNIVNATNFETEDAFPADFNTANLSSVLITRYNNYEVHTHTIKAGEFSRVENANWHSRGYSYSHAHVISPFIKEVYDMKLIHGKLLTVGNQQYICSSDNSGYSWNEYVNLLDIDTDPPESIQIIATNGNDILFGSDKKIIYHSTITRSEAVPLEKPMSIVPS